MMQTPDLRPCDSVLFDLDGTLWDASSTCAMAWTKSLELLGRPELVVTADDAIGFTGLQFDTILEEFFPSVGKELYQTFLDCYQQQELGLMEDQGGELYVGVKEVLLKLSRTHKLFVVSNCLDGYVENFFRWTGLEPLFDGWESLGRSGRPKASNIASVIKDQGLRFPIYVGDTAHDAEAARKNRIPFVFVEYGFGNVESPLFAISSLGELLDLL